MKIQLKFAAALAALLMITNSFPVCASSTDIPPETPASSQNNTLLSNSVAPEELETMTSGDTSPSSDDAPKQDLSPAETERPDMTVPDEAPMFSAHVAYSPHGFVVKGTFTELLPGTSLIQFLYSLDGEVWQTGDAWTSEIGDGVQQIPTAFQNLTCLHDGFEPLSGYIAGQFNRFYLKLQITLENELTYETQAAVIDRGDPLTISEELTPVAGFTSTMRILQRNPFKLYGQYQITVSADATPEDISALLPDTLPMEVQLFSGNNMVTNAVVDCPITWKPLSLPLLTAGESVTIADAAEEIIIPAGTLLNTPIGIFQLNEPLGIAQDDIVQDEIRLVLNVVAENADPTGVLAGYNSGLEVAFHLKPTGATAIRAYTLLEGDDEWVELPDSLRLEEVNAPSSIANSAHTFVLRNTSEPYQSYLAARNAGDEPLPFLVGLKVEGGVYDGRQLILAWPDTYERLTTLPALNGCGGNESNAGSDNKNDSTPEGQRPGLPQEPKDEQDAQQPTQEPKDEQDTQQPEPSQKPKDEQNTQQPTPSHKPKDEQDAQQPTPSHKPKDEQNTQQPTPSQKPKDEQDAQQPEPSQKPKDEQDAQQPEPSQKPKDEQDAQQPESQQKPQDELNSQQPSQKPQDELDSRQPEAIQDSKNTLDSQQPEPSQKPQDELDSQQPEAMQDSKNALDSQQPEAQQKPQDQQDTQESELPQSVQEPQLTPIPAVKPELSQTPKYKPEAQQTNLHWLLFPATATIAIVICIIVAIGKLTTGNMSGRISVKMVHTLCRLLHLK